MDRRTARELDNYITGNYGNDQFDDADNDQFRGVSGDDERPEPDYCEGCWTSPCDCPKPAGVSIPRKPSKLIGRVVDIPSGYYAGHWGTITAFDGQHYTITGGSIGETLAPIFDRSEFRVRNKYSNRPVKGGAR
jgi:hypothetical protein